jgi:MYXO-CTERM domain-containing protein
MFRYWIGLFASLSFALSSQAQSTIGVLLASGPKGGEPTSAHFSWYNVPTDVRAIAVTSIVTMSANPLGTSLVNLATGVPIDPATVSAADPLTFSLPNAAFGQGLAGGSIPAGFFPTLTPPAPSGPPATMGVQTNQPAAGPGTAGYSLYSPDGNFLGSATVPVPEDGWWVIGVDGSGKEPEGPPIPVEMLPTVNTPEPATLLMGGMGLAALAGWRIRRKRS